MAEQKDLVERSHPQYKYFVDDHDETSYDIYAERLNKGQKIVCPHDDDMFVKKNEDGSISVVKRSFSKCIFSKKEPKDN